MKYLFFDDLKRTKKILMLYYVLILFVTCFIDVILGWIMIAYIIKIDRDLWKENLLLQLPSYYKNMPRQNLYPDEKNCWFYSVALSAIVLWGVACLCNFDYDQILNQSRSTSYFLIIFSLGNFMLFFASLYHVTWAAGCLKWTEITKISSVLNKCYLAFALIVLIIIRTKWFVKWIRNILNPSLLLCGVMLGINLIIFIASILLLRKLFREVVID